VASRGPDSPPTSKVVVFDTNVLLADPNSLLSFPRAEVVIPETVLGELDKLKTARVDPDLRFRGREVSRLLFELSEEGSLVDGVDLPDGGRLRVATFESDTDLPDGLVTRNADDRILATTFQICRAGGGDCDVTLITNDLNMLLKAQTLGIPVTRYGEGLEGGFAKKYIIRPFQRYKVPIGILAVALGVFAGVLVIAYVLRVPATTTAVPAEFTELLSAQQQRALQALTTLERDPRDRQSLLSMGNVYFGLVTQAQAAGDRPAELQYSRLGIRYYDRYLALEPGDNDARADMASLFFYSGQTDRAIQEVGTVLESNPEHVNGNYNLGIFYWRGRRDLQAASDQMRRVIELTQDRPGEHATLELARSVLDQIEIEAETSGGTVETEVIQ
jgi:hypothetical protein